jgi:segregation and condensation protein B
VEKTQEEGKEEDFDIGNDEELIEKSSIVINNEDDVNIGNTNKKEEEVEEKLEESEEEDESEESDEITENSSINDNKDEDADEVAEETDSKVEALEDTDNNKEPDEGDGFENIKKTEEIPITSETVREIEEEGEIENLKKIEAALFLSARYLNLQQLVMLTDINPLMLKELLGKLIEKYNHENSSIEILSKENMWKMDVRQEYVSMINKLATGSSEFTKAEQETLAVIAYKQPVKQSVVVKIRGNKSYDHIKHFISIGLLQAKKLGHTKELKLSDDFFEYFHLQKKDGKMMIENSGINDISEEKEEENGNRGGEGNNG